MESIPFTTNRKGRPMHPSTKRFTRGRIAGLTLIALLTLGSATSISPPARSPFPCLPARMQAKLTLKSCTYNTEKGAYRADCGTLVVPENRANPHSRLIAFPVTRIRALRHTREHRCSASRAAPASPT